MAFTFTTEYCSDSQRNGVRLQTGIAFIFDRIPHSRPWLLSTAAKGGLKPAPVSRFRGAYPHRLSSYALLSLHGLSRSWHTIVRIASVLDLRIWPAPRGFNHLL